MIDDDTEDESGEEGPGQMTQFPIKLLKALRDAVDGEDVPYQLLEEALYRAEECLENCDNSE